MMFSGCIERKHWSEMGQLLGIVPFVRTQKFSEKLTFLTPNTHTYV